jgi:nucleoid-associated protein EbfC
MPKQPDFGAILKQAQQMQADMLQAQEALKDETVEATVGGGVVYVRMTGDLELKEIKIDAAAVDPDDVEMLQDMVLAAVNEAIRSAQELAASKMNQAAGGLGGLGLPGL